MTYNDQQEDILAALLEAGSDDDQTQEQQQDENASPKPKAANSDTPSSSKDNSAQGSKPTAQKGTTSNNDKGVVDVRKAVEDINTKLDDLGFSELQSRERDQKMLEAVGDIREFIYRELPDALDQKMSGVEVAAMDLRRENEQMKKLKAEKGGKTGKVTLLVCVVVAIITGSIGGAYFGPAYGMFDDTKGWKDAIWNTHGKQIQRCYAQARTEKRKILCQIPVQ